MRAFRSVALLLGVAACGGSTAHGGDDTADAPPPGDTSAADAPPAGNGTSNYKVDDAVITFDFAANVPGKGENALEPTTGATVHRLTGVAGDLPTSGNLYNEYSRYSAENATGEYVLAVGDNSTSSVVLERATSQVIATLAYDESGDPAHRIGALHEVRWHPTADHPYRVYYVLGTELRMIDDVRSQSTTRSTIEDFGPLIDWGASATSERRVYNDQEGNCSHDGDHFAFMAAYYVNGSPQVRAFVHYQISTNTLHTLYPADLAGMARAPAGESTRETFRYKPNMVEVAPDGSGILLHHARAYPGSYDEYVGTIFEAPSLWPIDLRATQFTPFRVGPDATHSGWAMLGGAWYLVQQDNRRDRYTAVPISGPNRGYGAEGQVDVSVGLNTAGIIDFFQDGPYYAGAHFGVTGAALDGWCLVSTYTTDSSTVQYRGGGLFLQQLKPIAESPVIWHVAPTFNIWPSDNKQDYNEAQAAMNLQGNRIDVAGNWETNLDHVELLEIELPAAWRAHFGQ